MTRDLGAALVRRPTKAQLIAAKTAMSAQQEAGHYTCGCFAALCRNPLYSGLEGHWRAYHPRSLAILRDAQAHALARLGREAAAIGSVPRMH